MFIRPTKYLRGAFSADPVLYAPGGFIGQNTSWTLDGTSAKAFPQSATEFTAQAFPTPSHLYTCQEASGNLLDKVASANLTTSGSPLYQQAVAGWSNKAVGASGAASNQFFSTAAVADTATTSVAFLIYALINQPVSAGQRAFYGAASNDAFESVAGSNVIRLRTGAQAGNGALDHTGQVRPYLVVHDKTNNVNAIWTNIEKKAITFAAASGTSFQMQTGISADTTSNTKYLLAVLWEGAAAEALNNDTAVKSMLQSMGWSISGY